MEALCSTPDCAEVRREEGRFCQDCAENLARIRQELSEDPALLYNKRSDNADRLIVDPEEKKARKKSPRRPTCCVIGCYEFRIRGEAFCDAHKDHAAEEEE